MKKEVNQEFFTKWAPEMAYVLGFFMADGSIIRNKRGGYYLNIQIRDKNLLYSIRKALCSNHKISVKPAKGNAREKYNLQIGSKKMCFDLQKMGVQRRKTYTLTIPKIPRKFFWHFVRGYFDGDGNVWKGFIHKDRPQPLLVLFTAFTSCSEDFLRSLQQGLEETGLGKGSLVSLQGSSYYRLQYAVRDSLLLADSMYKGQYKSLYLKRKKDIFDKFKRTRL